MKVQRKFQPVENTEDVIDSRDIIGRIEDLEFNLDSEIIDEAEAEELKCLKELADDGEGSPDWQYVAVLISDSYFPQYAQELAEDIGAVDADAEWPLRHIDWEAAAEELKADYFSVDFDGVEYWIRA